MELIVTCAEESVAFAEAELRATLGDGVRLRALGRGVLGVVSGRPARELAERLMAAGPVFIRHQMPVDAIAAIGRGDAWAAEIVDAALALLVGDADGSALATGVQIRDVTPGGADGPSRRAFVWQALSRQLPAEVRVDARHPERVLSVLLGAEEAWLGLAPVGLHLSAWAGGERHFARRGDQASRAEYKLREALECFGLAPPKGGRAVDLGAAPGGWTQVLAEAGLVTTAVDPGDMAPSVMALPGVRHVRGHAEDFLTRAAASGERFDMLVNDMRMDAREAARLLELARGCLAPGALVVTTLKLPRNGLRARLREALVRLESGFRVLGVRQLFHNRAEVTAALRLEP